MNTCRHGISTDDPDAAACAFYENPENQVPAGPAHRRTPGTAEIRARDGDRCARCGSPQNLHVHHRKAGLLLPRHYDPARIPVDHFLWPAGPVLLDGELGFTLWQELTPHRLAHVTGTTWHETMATIPRSHAATTRPCTRPVAAPATTPRSAKTNGKAATAVAAAPSAATRP